VETKWASLVSYGLTAQALKDFLPVDETLSVSTVRANALAVAQRCEAELGDEQMSFIDGCPRDWEQLPEHNQGFIPNNGERYRQGERISTGFVVA
jgi:hypothetical protein